MYLTIFISCIFYCFNINQQNSAIIKNVGLNPTRIGFYKLLKTQGAKINFKNLKKKNDEIRGDIFVKNCKLKAIRASKKYYVNSTDEYPYYLF